MERRSLVVLALYQLLASNRSGIFTVYFVLFLVADKGASIPVALALLSAAYVAASLVGPLAGRASDRQGRRWPFLLFGEAASLPFFLAVPWVPGYLAAGATFIVAETLLAVGSPALNAFVADLTRESERGWGYGFLNASGAAGAIGGFLVAGLLAERYGYASLFVLVAALMVGTVTIVLLFLPNEVTARSPPERRPLAEMRELSIFSTTVSIRALGAGAVITFYGTYAGLLGASPFEIALIVVAGLAATAVASIPLGRVVDREGEIRGLLWGTALSLVSFAIYAAATSWWVLAPARVTYVVGFALMNPAMLVWVTRMAPEGRRAEYLGFFSLINSVLWSLGPLFGGVAILLAGTVGLFAFAMVSTVVSLVALWVLYPHGARPAVPGRTTPG